MKKTKVICSIGPASDCVEVMGEMVNMGMDCARINLSHATPEGILKTLEVIRQVRRQYNRPLAIMYDTKGPEFRTLSFKDGGVSLKKDDTIRMSKTCILGNNEEFGVNHSNAIDFIKVGDKVLIDNALFELEVIGKSEDHVVLKALDIAFAAKHACDYLALSFVNTREDVISARKIIEDAGGDALIISKIESRLGIENVDDIIEESDGIMVARGDLGVEIPLEELPMLQKSIIRKCRQKGKFAIVATEMLASMYESPRPTRAEVSDVANAILDGTDCVMLSGETTIGKHPIESVEIMSRICRHVESTVDYTKHVAYKGTIGTGDTIAKLVIDAVEFSDIKLIVTTTLTGFTAQRISNFRPNSIIMACCPSNHIAEKVILNFGVKPVVTDIYESTDELLNNAKKIAQKEFNLKKGDLIVVTGGFPLGEYKKTNYLIIEEI